MYNLQYSTLGHFIFILYSEQTIQPSWSCWDSPSFIWKSWILTNMRSGDLEENPDFDIFQMNSYDTRYKNT